MIGVGKVDEARRSLAWLLHASRLDRPRLPVLTVDGRRAPRGWRRLRASRVASTAGCKRTNALSPPRIGEWRALVANTGLPTAFGKDLRKKPQIFCGLELGRSGN